MTIEKTFLYALLTTKRLMTPRNTIFYYSSYEKLALIKKNQKIHQLYGIKQQNYELKIHFKGVRQGHCFYSTFTCQTYFN